MLENFQMKFAYALDVALKGGQHEDASLSRAFMVAV
jgi:hypothetical protein